MSGASLSAASGPIRPRRRPGENRAGLLSAGILEFGLHGYSAAQTSAIAQRAGVSQPNVYANFASKQDLFVACIRELSVAALPPAQAAHDDRRRLHGPGAHLSDAHCLLLYQAIAALGDPGLSIELLPMINELKAELGEHVFEGAILRGVKMLTSLT